MPFLLTPRSEHAQQWLVGMDEFLHAALATIATAYFDAFRKSLLEQAEVGRVVQEGLSAEIPKRLGDLEIGHVYVSAHEHALLGGDFVDVFPVSPEKAAFILGDFSGHGLEAVADAFKLRSMFRAFIRENHSLDDAMGRLNNVLASELPPDRFATALAIMYDSHGCLSIVNAGHPYPVACDGKCRLVEVYGPVLGVGVKSDFPVQEVELAEGEVFLAYTDGVIEARSGGELFGESRLIEAVEKTRLWPAQATAEHLVDTALRYSGGRFRDDVAVLVLKRA